MTTGSRTAGIETALNAETNTPQVVTYNPDASPADPVDYEKITTLISKVHSSYLSGSVFYANNSTIWTVLANIVDTTGRPIFIPDTTAGGVGRMLGFVVKADAGVSANSVIFGNANKGYVFNTNEPMSWQLRNTSRLVCRLCCLHYCRRGSTGHQGLRITKKILVTVSPESATFDLKKKVTVTRMWC